MQIISQLIQGMLHLAIFSSLPFVYYIVTRKTAIGFLKYIALQWPKHSSRQGAALPIGAARSKTPTAKSISAANYLPDAGLVLNLLLLPVWLVLINRAGESAAHEQARQSAIPLFIAVTVLSIFLWVVAWRFMPDQKGLRAAISVYMLVAPTGCLAVLIATLFSAEEIVGPNSSVALLIASAVIEAAFYALSEMVLFFGFFAQRLISRLGPVRGSIIHSAVFGLLHGIVLVGYGPVFAVAGVLCSGCAAFMLGILTARKTNGSIAPGLLAYFIYQAVWLCALTFALGI